MRAAVGTLMYSARFQEQTGADAARGQFGGQLRDSPTRFQPTIPKPRANGSTPVGATTQIALSTAESVSSARAGQGRHGAHGQGAEQGQPVVSACGDEPYRVLVVAAPRGVRAVIGAAEARRRTEATMTLNEALERRLAE